MGVPDASPYGPFFLILWVFGIFLRKYRVSTSLPGIVDQLLSDFAKKNTEVLPRSVSD